MPWKPVEEMSLKREFVELAGREGANMSELCRRFGVSRPTGYKWLKRWREGGVEALFARSRRPGSSPGRTSAPMEEKIVAVRTDNPVWGGRKIRRRLQDLGVKGVPSASTVTEVLRRHGKLGPESRKSSEGSGWKRFERKRPNELWQMDFKGHFELGSGGRCHPLGVLDDHSRFNLVLEACANERGATVRGHLEVAFKRYGLPDKILCDNGAPWGDIKAPLTRVGVWLLESGVDICHGRPWHPQTQGKEERFHRTLQAEVLSRRTAWRDLGQCAEHFASWREKYNHERPHESLDDRVPAAAYQPSRRIFPEQLPEPESHYVEGDELRRVKSKGEITFRNRFFLIGRAFRGKTIALRPRRDGVWEVYFCWKSLGLIDLSLPAKEKYRYESLVRAEREEGEEPSTLEPGSGLDAPASSTSTGLQRGPDV